jgi:hypothetical protein
MTSLCVPLPKGEAIEPCKTHALFIHKTGKEIRSMEKKKFVLKRQILAEPELKSIQA